MPDFIYLYFELMAFATCLIKYRDLKNTLHKYFLPYLLFIVVFEICSVYDLFIVDHSNLWIANITMGLSFIFYSIFLTNLLQTAVFVKWIKRLIFLSIIFSLINMAFIQGFWKLDTITILLQFLVLILLTCFCFYELMSFNNSELIVTKIPAFWISTGLLFFCLGKFLFFASFAYFAYKPTTVFPALSYVVSNIANAILYSCLTISFLCFKKMRNLSL
jgi:hypothetical protein